MWELKEISPLLAVVVPLVGAVAVWCLNECAKRRWEKYKRKEERYTNLLESLCGFYVSSQNSEQKNKFIQELRLAWLYCPDKVIRAGNAFLATVETNASSSDAEKERALAEFVLALRRNLNCKTRLTVDEHRNWKST